MAKPARPDLVFHNIDEMIADAQSLRDGQYEKAGQWDLPMILDHLAKTMSSPFKPGMKNLPWPAGPIARFFLRRIARRTIYPSIKFPAPKMIQPNPGIDLESAFVEFLEFAEKVKTLTGETVIAPPFGKVNLTDYQKIQLLHGAHHLSFLKLK